MSDTERKKYSTESFYTLPGRVAMDPKFLPSQGKEGSKDFKPALLRFKVVDSTKSENHVDMWVEVTLAGKRAEIFQNLKKGDKVTVGGKPEMRMYESGGETRASIEIRFPHQFALQSELDRTGSAKEDEDPFA